MLTPEHVARAHPALAAISMLWLVVIDDLSRPERYCTLFLPLSNRRSVSAFSTLSHGYTKRNGTVTGVTASGTAVRVPTDVRLRV
jgi:hypothetical protein